jgi:hypothetical protein
MVGMPYVLLGAVGFLIYRGLKQKALAEQMNSAASTLSGERGPSCSGQSLVDAS